MKACTKCGEVKAPTEFHRNSASKDGLFHRCKKCASEYERGWRRRNPEAAKDRDKKKDLNRKRRRTPEQNTQRLKEYWARRGRVRGDGEKEKKKAQDKRRIEGLLDVYIKRQLRNRGFQGPIPSEVIEMKREQLRLQRLGQKIRQAIKSSEKA